MKKDEANMDKKVEVYLDHKDESRRGQKPWQNRDLIKRSSGITATGIDIEYWDNLCEEREKATGLPVSRGDLWQVALKFLKEHPEWLKFNN